MSKVNNILREDYEKEKNKLHRDNLRSYHKQIRDAFNRNLEESYINFLNEHPELTFEEQEMVRLFLNDLLHK